MAESTVQPVPAFANTPEDAMRCLEEYCKRQINNYISCIVDTQIKQHDFAREKGEM